MLLGHLIGEAISEIQSGRMHSLAPSFMGFGDPSRPGCRYGHYIEAQSVYQVRHLLPDVTVPCVDMHATRR